MRITLPSFLPSFLLLVLLMLSCEQNDQLLTPKESNNLTAQDKSGGGNSGPGETILGQKLQNPYALANVRSATVLLGGNPKQITPTHYYLRFIPEDGSQTAELEDYAEENDYEFEIQPIHFEVLYEGAEGYSPLGPDEKGIVPEYGAVNADDFLTGNLPNVPYEVIDIMHLSDYESLLTFTAYVISGNEQYYEAVDGFCHPDCPSWPVCLDQPEFTCRPLGGVELVTVDPFSTEGREKFPDYVLDDKMGKDGLIGPIKECLYIVNDPPECEKGCSPVLVPIPNEPDACRWECQCSPGGGDDDDPSGGNPHPGLVEQCDCLVFEDERMPGGRVVVEDTQLGDEALRRVKVMTTRHFWGFIWKNTNTNDQGCWKIFKRYNVKRMKTKIVFRDRVSDRMVIRSVRGFRPWNLSLKPVKKNFRVRRNNRVWNDQCIRIIRSEDQNSRDDQTFMAATTNNAIHEYYGFEGLPEIGNLNILLHTWDKGWVGAPMFGKSDEANVFSPLEFLGFLTEIIGLDQDVSDFLGASSWPDIMIHLNTKVDDGDPFYGSDDRKNIVYHEMAHTSQFAHLGADWWAGYRAHIFSVELKIGFRCKPYGDGTELGAPFAALTEGMAESIDGYYTDLQYGDEHSRNRRTSPDNITRGRYLNKAEKLDFWPGCNTKFIPEGLFFDLFDVNGVFPPDLALSEIKEIARLRSGLNEDRIGGFTFNRQMDALNPFVSNIDEFKERLFTQSGAITNTSRSDYDELFRAYEH